MRPEPPCRGGGSWGLCLGLLSLSCRPTGGVYLKILPATLEAPFVYLLLDIGLAPGAIISLNVSNAVPSNDTVLVLLSSHQLLLSLPLKSWHGSYSSYVLSDWRQPFSGSLIADLHVGAPKPDRYFIGVVNVHQKPMVLGGTIAYVNPGGQHLPLQLAHVPEMLRVASFAFVLLMLTAAMLLLSIWHREATLLHALLVACLWLKASELALRWRYFSILDKNGEAPLWRFKVWQFTFSLHEISELLLLLITALGWRVLRPRLTALEIRGAASAMGLAALLATLEVLSDPSSDELVSFRLLFDIVRVMCYLVIIFAMNFNLQLIAVHLAESPVTPAIAVLYRKQQAYVGFRRIFLAIVFRPSVLLMVQRSMFGALEVSWAADAFREASSWAIYAGLLAVLQPGMAQCRLLRLVRAVVASDAAANAVSPGPAAGGQAAGAEGPLPAAATPAAGDAEVAVAAPAALLAEADSRGANEEADSDLAAPYVPLAGGE